ncbi:MAG: RagB/SusD family nutrient uptake outer membrane protein [Bacteroidales bacterium]|nr:RagB/SusD family nutrient uptake outer membrane protein [Bacteroidales bacterium]
MKRTAYILLLIAGMLSVSCLDKLPTDGIPAETAITTVADAAQAVTGIYSAYKSSALYSGNLTLLPDIQADLVYAVNGYSNTYGDIWRWNILSNDELVTGTWAALYGVIGRCNFLLDRTPDIMKKLTDDDLADELSVYEAEAYFARALAYSELVKFWCKTYESRAQAEKELGVVISKTYNSKETPVRATLAESYDFIISDLEKAEKGLTPKEGYTGSFYDSIYFSLYTVYALRARLALYMNDWENAVKYSSLVIDSGKFWLSDCNELYDSEYSYYDYMWQMDHSTEAIWKVGFELTSYGGSLGRVFFNYDYSSFKPDYVPATWVLNLYESSDLRYSSFFETVQTGYSHGLTWPLVVKYLGNAEYLAAGILHVNMPKVFRLSEQYLIRAEAYIRQNQLSKAATDITTLRKARYSSYSGTALNESNAMETIENERVRELFMEGFRLNDLKRWHKGFKREPQEQSISNGSSLNVAADAPLFVWPIPQHELMTPGSKIEPNESNH